MRMERSHLLFDRDDTVFGQSVYIKRHRFGHVKAPIGAYYIWLNK